jgi:hypothetical protein
MSAAALVALACVLLGQAVAPSGNGEPTTANAFSITVVGRDVREASKFVWIGIRNETRSAQLICVMSRGAWQVVVGRAGAVTAEGFGPHACDTDENYVIVLPNQTLFEGWNGVRELQLTENVAIVVSVQLMTRDPIGGQRVFGPLEWKGANTDMVAAFGALR